MTITEQKRLIAEIPEDLVEGEEIEVSDDGKSWHKEVFSEYDPHCVGIYSLDDKQQIAAWIYARRPAAAKKDCDTCKHYSPNKLPITCRTCDTNRSRCRTAWRGGRNERFWYVSL